MKRDPSLCPPQSVILVPFLSRPVLRFLLCLSLCFLLSPSPGPPQSVYSRLLVSWNDYNRNLRSEVGRLEIRVEEHFLRRLNYAKVVIKVFHSLKVSSPSLCNTDCRHTRLPSWTSPRGPRESRKSHIVCLWGFVVLA